MQRILVVDDSKFSRNRLIGPLAESGYEVIAAENGRLGFEAYQLHSPDLVITDLLMPEMDGFGLLKSIREVDQQTPVIVVSADIQQTSRQRIEELGVTRFLNKPFVREELLTCIRNLTARQSSDACESNT